MHALADHVERAGFVDGTPLAVARVLAGAPPDSHASGAWPGGRAVVDADRFYAASLAKQVTGAALAVLVRDGTIDPDLPIDRWVADLPSWAEAVTPRQLAHHIGGLPAAGDLEAGREGSDWTDAFALAALRRFDRAPLPAGQRYVYSNVGYILLGRVIAAASGQSLADFATTRLLRPHGLVGMGFLEDPTGQPQLAFMGPGLPLSHGDGGLWVTAPAFANWLHLLNIDAFGLADLMEAPGRLADGNAVDYGWGMGLREFRGYRLFIHGGEWTGAVAKAVRCPALGIGIVALAAGAPFETLDRLVGSLLTEA